MRTAHCPGACHRPGGALPRPRPDPRRAWRMRGKLAEAAELRDGGIEAARLFGNTQALVWTLSAAPPRARHRRPRARARHRAGGRRPQRASSRQASTRSRRGSSLAPALLDTGQPQAGVELLVGSAGGEELALIAGQREGARPRAPHPVLASARPPPGGGTRCRGGSAWARVGAAPDGRRLGRSRGCGRRACTPATPPRAAEQALAAAAAADEVGAPMEAALSRTLAGRALAGAGERDRAAAELQRAAAALERCGALRLPRRGGARAEKARPAHPPAHAPGYDRRRRTRVVDRARAPGSAARRRPQDESGDRG